MLARVLTFRKLDLKQRDVYLTALRSAHGRGTTARCAGVSLRMVQKLRLAHPDFAQQELDAEKQASDAVDDGLFQAGINGNVKACIFWLINRRPERWSLRPHLRPPPPGPPPRQLSTIVVSGPPTVEDMKRLRPEQLAEMYERAMAELAAEQQAAGPAPAVAPPSGRPCRP
jgi:hypothetical protein